MEMVIMVATGSNNLPQYRQLGDNIGLISLSAAFYKPWSSALPYCHHYYYYFTDCTLAVIFYSIRFYGSQNMYIS